MVVRRKWLSWFWLIFYFDLETSFWLVLIWRHNFETFRLFFYTKGLFKKALDKLKTLTKKDWRGDIWAKLSGNQGVFTLDEIWKILINSNKSRRVEEEVYGDIIFSFTSLKAARSSRIMEVFVTSCLWLINLRQEPVWY